MGVGTAERRGQYDEKEGGEAHDLILSKDEADDGHDESGNEQNQKRQVKNRCLIKAARFFKRKPCREEKTDDEKQASDGQNQRAYSADPAFAKLTLNLGRLQV